MYDCRRKTKREREREKETETFASTPSCTSRAWIRLFVYIICLYLILWHLKMISLEFVWNFSTEDNSCVCVWVAQQIWMNGALADFSHNIYIPWWCSAGSEKIMRMKKIWIYMAQERDYDCDGDVIFMVFCICTYDKKKKLLLQKYPSKVHNWSNKQLWKGVSMLSA